MTKTRQCTFIVLAGIVLRGCGHGPDVTKRRRTDPPNRAHGVARCLRFSVGTVFLLLFPSGCGELFTGPGVDEIAQLPRALSAGEVEIIGASNRFAFDLLAQANRPNDNLFLSPLSASMALGMTMNGAAGETWNQMRNVLGEAAAATAVEIVAVSSGPVVRADRPFLSFIRERLSGTILFAGKVASPPGG